MCSGFWRTLTTGSLKCSFCVSCTDFNCQVLLKMVMDEFYFNIHTEVLCQGVETRGLPTRGGWVLGWIRVLLTRGKNSYCNLFCKHGDALWMGKSSWHLCFHFLSGAMSYLLARQEAEGEDSVPCLSMGPPPHWPWSCDVMECLSTFLIHKSCICFCWYCIPCH